jgi:prepilin signal peptidase PulO-like enzyme (type II secretory pathway)
MLEIFSFALMVTTPVLLVGLAVKTVQNFFDNRLNHCIFWLALVSSLRQTYFFMWAIRPELHQVWDISVEI